MWILSENKHWHRRRFLIAISIYCSHHTNLYKTEGFLQQDQRKRVSLPELQIWRRPVLSVRTSVSGCVFVLAPKTRLSADFTGRSNQRRTYADLKRIWLGVVLTQRSHGERWCFDEELQRFCTWEARTGNTHLQAVHVFNVLIIPLDSQWDYFKAFLLRRDIKRVESNEQKIWNMQQRSWVWLKVTLWAHRMSTFYHFFCPQTVKSMLNIHWIMCLGNSVLLMATLHT